MRLLGIQTLPRIPELLLADTPAVFATIQAANIHPSTTGRGSVKLLEQPAEAVHDRANGLRQPHVHALSAVAGTGPPLSTEIHF